MSNLDYKTPENQKLIKKFNSFVRFYNSKLSLVLSREGELPSSYFDDGLEVQVNELLTITTFEPLKNNEKKLNDVFKSVKDGWRGLKTSGRY